MPGFYLELKNLSKGGQKVSIPLTLVLTPSQQQVTGELTGKSSPFPQD